MTTTPYQQDLADIYDVLYQLGLAKDYAAETADLTALIRARNPRAASLLDVACGTGAHLTHLRDSFDPVAGLELSEAMRRVATARLPGVPIHPGDLRDFALDVTFDAVTCLRALAGAGLTGIRWVAGWAEGHERLIATR